MRVKRTINMLGTNFHIFPMTSKKVLHGVTKIGARGQIVIPQAIREKLKIRSGDAMLVIAREGRIVVLPAAEMENVYREVLEGMESIRRKLRH